MKQILFCILILTALKPALLLAQKPGQPQTDAKLAQAEKLDLDGYHFFIERNYRRALDSFQNELQLRRAARDALGEAWALNQIGESYLSLGETQSALKSYNQALPLFRQLKESHGIARTLHALASCHAALGNNAGALKELTEALALVHASEDRQWEGMILGDIAITYLALGEKQLGFKYLNERLAYERIQTNQVGEADALKSLGAAYQSNGEKRKALDSYLQALSILREMSRRMTSDRLTAEIKDVQDAIKKLEN